MVSALPQAQVRKTRVNDLTNLSRQLLHFQSLSFQYSKYDKAWHMNLSKLQKLKKQNAISSSGESLDTRSFAVFSLR